MPNDYVAIDLETANPDYASVCSIGAVRFSGSTPGESFSTLIDPRDYFDAVNVSIHGITAARVKGSPRFERALDDLLEFSQDLPFVTHGPFDRIAIQRACEKDNLPVPTCPFVDTTRVVRRVWDEVKDRGYGLRSLAERLGITFRHHDALEDARATGLVLARAFKDSGTSIADWLVIQRTTGAYQAKISLDAQGEGPLSGESIVFTGSLSMTRPEAAALAAGAGASVRPNVSKSTTIVVVGDQDARRVPSGRSTKHRKAEELIAQGIEIRIIDERGFRELVVTDGREER